MPSAAPWMNLEILVESEKDRYHTVITYVWSLKKNDTNELIYKTEIDCSKKSVLHLPPISPHPSQY